jgi:hypothetical protein
MWRYQCREIRNTKVQEIMTHLKERKNSPVTDLKKKETYEIFEKKFEIRIVGKLSKLQTNN